MAKFWFDCSAFEISTQIQAINNILFPIFLFAIIFFVMCNIFLIDNNSPVLDKELVPGVVKTQIEENIPCQEDESKVENLFSSRLTNARYCKMELFDIEVEH